MRSHCPIPLLGLSRQTLVQSLHNGIFHTLQGLRPLNIRIIMKSIPVGSSISSLSELSSLNSVA